MDFLHPSWPTFSTNFLYFLSLYFLWWSYSSIVFWRDLNNLFALLSNYHCWFLCHISLIPYKKKNINIMRSPLQHCYLELYKLLLTLLEFTKGDLVILFVFLFFFCFFQFSFLFFLLWTWTRGHDMLLTEVK